MDNGVVTEEDLGSGFLFREEEGAVGMEVCLLLLPSLLILFLSSFYTFSTLLVFLSRLR